MHCYETRSKEKALALFVALSEAEFVTVVKFYEHRYYLATNASEEQFKIARMSIHIPSSNVENPLPDSITIPDHLPDNFS